MAFDIQNSRASQEFVPVKEVRDGVVVLDDGSLRAILMASSINLALKSADEQRSVLTQFKNFLNSLDFSVQLHVESRDLDIKPYLADLREQYEKQENELMQTQTKEYIEFIKTFTRDADIMQKSFFVVVPYTRPIVSSSGGIMDKIRSIIGKETTKKQEEKSFNEARTQLDQRVQLVEQGLVRTGVRVTQLDTEENIELFYRLLNPGNLTQEIRGDNLEV